MNIEITKDELENVAKEMRDYISPFLVAISVKKRKIAEEPVAVHLF